MRKTFSSVGNTTTAIQGEKVNPKICTGRDLAGVLAYIRLSEKDSAFWRHDLKNGRNILNAPTDKW